MSEPTTRRGIGPWDRRRFLIAAAKAGLGAVLAGGGCGVLEAKWCRVVRVTIGVPNLPRAFVGSTLAFLSDIHHGPFVPLGYVRHVVAMANALEPDIVALGGDYVHKGRKYIAPGIAELGRLRRSWADSPCSATTTTGMGPRRRARPCATRGLTWSRTRAPGSNGGEPA
jgi:hypothetical protein